MDRLEYEFQFEELNIAVRGESCPGMMIYGTALLTGDEEGFSVTTITIDGGKPLKRRGNGPLGFPADFEDALFSRISAVICDPHTQIGKRAIEEWAEMVATDTDDSRMGYSHGDHVYDAMREAAE